MSLTWMSLHTPGFTGTTPAPPALQKLLSFCCDLRHPTGNGHDLDFHPLAPRETETCQKPVCRGDGSQSLHQICRYSHTSPAESSSRSLLQSMIPNKSFIWVLASLKLLGFPSPSVCLRPAGAMLGFAAFLQESQRSSAQQPCTHWNHRDLPSCSQGSSSCTAQPASVGDLLNKNAELNNFLMNGQVLRVLSLPHKLQFTERSSAGTSPALSVPGYPTARGDRRGLLHRATQEIWSRDHVLT